MEAQLIQRVGTFCFLISLQHLILGEDTAGKRCRDSKRKKETLVEQIPGKKLKAKLEPLYFVSSCGLFQNQERIGMTGGSIDFSTGQIDLESKMTWFGCHSYQGNYPENAKPPSVCVT